MHLSDSAESVGQGVGGGTVEYLKAPTANYCPRFCLPVPPWDCDNKENGDIFVSVAFSLSFAHPFPKIDGCINGRAIRYAVPDISLRLGQTSSDGSLYSPPLLYLLCNLPLKPFKILYIFRKSE